MDGLILRLEIFLAACVGDCEAEVIGKTFEISSRNMSMARDR